VSSALIVIPGGSHGTYHWYQLPDVPDWEREMTEWLNTKLTHPGPIGEGIQERAPAPRV
jgi:alpha-L-fucosidase 2